MDPGDADPKAALVREVFEELRVRLNPNDLHPVISAPYDFGEGTIHFFEAPLPEPPSDITFDDMEILEHRWLSVREALALPVFPATETFLSALR